MTRFVLRLLLLAVFFNAAIGMPAHEATHLAHLDEVVVGHVDGDESPEDEQHEQHELCAWCHAGAQALALNAAPPSASPQSDGTDRFALPASDTLVRSARPRSFASRDPPLA
jgi:hypothetical protein